MTFPLPFLYLPTLEEQKQFIGRAYDEGYTYSVSMNRATGMRTWISSMGNDEPVTFPFVGLYKYHDGYRIMGFPKSPKDYTSMNSIRHFFAYARIHFPPK